MDRLLSGLEKVANKHSSIKVKAQAGRSSYESGVVEIIQSLSPDEFEASVNNCDIFVSHAGMGNVLLAAQLNKPLIIMPRQESFGEHINDHQVDTARAFTHRAGVTVVNNDEELEAAILSAVKSPKVESVQSNQQNDSRKTLISSIREFIDND